MSAAPSGAIASAQREPNEDAAEDGSVPALVPSRRYVVNVPMRLLLPTVACRRAREILRRQRSQGRHAKLAVLQVCAEFEESQRCRDGERCNCLHLSEPSVQLARLPVHVNTKLSTLDDAPFTRLPPGCTVPLWNVSKTRCGLYDSRYLYATKGALDAYRLFSESTAPPDTSKVRMQHCSHYLADMCVRGDECNFIHVAHVPGAPNCPDPANTECDIGLNPTTERLTVGMPPSQRGPTAPPFAPGAVATQPAPYMPQAVGWSPFPTHVLQGPAQYDPRTAQFLGQTVPYYVPVYLNPAMTPSPPQMVIPGENLPPPGFALGPQSHQTGSVFLVAQPMASPPPVASTAPAMYFVTAPGSVPQIGLGPGVSPRFAANRPSIAGSRDQGQDTFPPPT